MIREVSDLKEVEMFLKTYFPSYIVSNDPYEKIYTYIDEDIIGLISISVMYERAEINYIAVKEESRRLGIGTKLIKYVLDGVKDTLVNSVSLEVDTKNEVAINLYEKFGFKIKSVREKYYGDKDAYLMVKDLR